MKVTRAEAAQNRERILEEASRLFRERGFDGVGVADIMAAAGLTHGGFYGHFASKDDLIAQACERALADSVAAWKRRVDAAPGKPLAGIVERYLSPVHRDDPGAGCTLAALGGDIARQRGAVRRAVSDGLAAQLGTLAMHVSGRTAAVRRRKAIATYAGMIGAMLLARAVDNPALSAEIMAAVTHETLDAGARHEPADARP